MSSPAAGKFQDHYEVLGVDPKASSEVIQAAYARMADKYHPQSGTNPDHEKYESITLAFEVLSDPELRSDFNKLKGIGQDDKPKFSGLTFFEQYGRDTHLRIALLCVLYDRRRTKPFTPALSMRHLEAIFSASSQELNFAIWYLKQKNLVTMNDKSSLQITTEGMDYLVAHQPAPDIVMPLIKASGLVGETPDEAAGEEAGEAPQAAEVAPAAPNPAVVGSALKIGSLLAKRKVS